ncbi:MAG TPA: regulatory iron-sulfur-containing complex subunit RicT [Planctomycetota bacterium]|nr:regulatory iron-sulfur-containing complex subunit RicT [Planctomycetota bacterium]
MALYVLAKYGDISHLATFRTPLGDLRRGERVVVRTERGTEIGTVVQPPFEQENGAADKSSDEVLRRINSDDLVRINQIESVDRMAEMKYCRERITSHNLPMKLVDIEHIFGSEKIIFYFLADGRVDFRQLVKDLAKEYRTRIELKQIGVRDEARLLADYNHCGEEICCRTFIRDLQPVTMKMAKAQKATLDPSKISGRCGRLMCCLRYEDKVYDELKKMLPRKGATVVTEHGRAEVIDYDIISQTLRVENAEGRIVKVSMKEVKQVIPRDEKEYQRRQQERSQRSQQPRAQGAQSTESQKPGDGPKRSKRRRRRGEQDHTEVTDTTPAPEAAQNAPAPDAPANAPSPDAPANAPSPDAPPERGDNPTDTTPDAAGPDTGSPQQGSHP